jgi:hypothetical protein
MNSVMLTRLFRMFVMTHLCAEKFVRIFQKFPKLNLVFLINMLPMYHNFGYMSAYFSSMYEIDMLMLR